MNRRGVWDPWRNGFPKTASPRRWNHHGLPRSSSTAGSMARAADCLGCCWNGDAPPPATKGGWSIPSRSPASVGSSSRSGCRLGGWPSQVWIRLQSLCLTGRSRPDDSSAVPSVSEGSRLVMTGAQPPADDETTWSRAHVTMVVQPRGDVAGDRLGSDIAAGDGPSLLDGDGVVGCHHGDASPDHDRWVGVLEGLHGEGHPGVT
jgi:hypothetical protein